MSVWHTPTAPIFTFTSPTPGVGSSISSTRMSWAT